MCGSGSVFDMLAALQMTGRIALKDLSNEKLEHGVGSCEKPNFN